MPKTQLHSTRIPNRQTHAGNITRSLATLTHHSFAGGAAKEGPPAPARHLLDLVLLRPRRSFGLNPLRWRPIVAMAMTGSLYTQAGAGCNAAAIIVGRPTARNWGKLRNRTKLWKVRRLNRRCERVRFRWVHSRDFEIFRRKSK